jgi:hypothetical protein
LTANSIDSFIASSAGKESQLEETNSNKLDKYDSSRNECHVVLLSGSFRSVL